MKAGLSFSKRYVPEFMGNENLPSTEQFIAVLQMPEAGDIFNVLDQLQKAGLSGNVDQKKVNMEVQIALLKEAGHLVPKYVKLDNAEDFTIEQVVKLPPFFPLAVDLLFALVKFAQPTETDTKNSEGLPA